MQQNLNKTKQLMIEQMCTFERKPKLTNSLLLKSLTMLSTEQTIESMRLMDLSLID